MNSTLSAADEFYYSLLIVHLRQAARSLDGGRKESKSDTTEECVYVWVREGGRRGRTAETESRGTTKQEDAAANYLA